MFVKKILMVILFGSSALMIAAPLKAQSTLNPKYYKNLFTKEQKAKVKEIQKEYAEKTKPLDAQIKELKAKIKELDKQKKELTAPMSKEIEGLLTPDQLTKAKKLQDEADAERKAKAEQKKKKADKK